MLGSSLGCEHGENTSTATNVKHDLVLEKVLVVVDRRAVRQGSHFILQHFLLSVLVSGHSQRDQVPNFYFVNACYKRKS